MRRRRLVTLLGSVPLLAACGIGREGSSYYAGPLSDHFDGKRFFNPGGEPPRPITDLIRWQLGDSGTDWPESFPSPFPPDRPPPRVERGLRVSFAGHASFLIQAAGQNILTDPVWSDRASPFSFTGPKRVNPPGIGFDDLPRIDTVLISHAHYDHMDLATIARLWGRDRPRIVAPLGNDTIIREAGSDIAVTTADWGEAVALTNAVQAHLVPVHHWAARGVLDRNHALWCGFVLTGVGSQTIFFAGDTGFDGGRPFRGVAQRFGAPDLALLPIGAYEPRWFMAPQHMNPAEAVEGFGLLGARHALGYHWGSFRLTNEAIEQPPTDLATALQAQRIASERFLAMRPGQVWEPAVRS